MNSDNKTKAIVKAELGIESNVPIPPGGKGNHGIRSLAGKIAKAMDIGDSRVVPLFIEAERLRDALYRQGFRARILRQIENGRLVYRVWKKERLETPHSERDG